jgi:hypothetical protein
MKRMSRNSYGRRRSNIDWEGIGAFVIGLLLVGGVTTGVVAVVNQDWCTGIEPDGETEQIVCPDGWREGETRNIQEDEYAEWDD